MKVERRSWRNRLKLRHVERDGPLNPHSWNITSRTHQLCAGIIVSKPWFVEIPPKLATHHAATYDNCVLTILLAQNNSTLFTPQGPVNNLEIVYEGQRTCDTIRYVWLALNKYKPEDPLLVRCHKFWSNLDARRFLSSYQFHLLFHSEDMDALHSKNSAVVCSLPFLE